MPIGFSSYDAVEGVELVISYNHKDFSFYDFQLSDSFDSYQVVINDLIPGKISLIIYAGTTVSYNENIIGDIMFNIVNHDVSNSIVSIDKMLSNGFDQYSGFLIIDEDDGLYSRELNISASSTNYPKKFALDSCYPNPFNPTTQIPFSVPVQSNVSITVYDISGRFITKLVSDIFDSGNHSVKFDGRNLASGIYIVKMDAKSSFSSQAFSQSSKILLVK